MSEPVPISCADGCGRTVPIKEVETEGWTFLSIQRRCDIDRTVGRMFPATKGTWVKAVDAEAEIVRLHAALTLAKRMCDEALPKFDWGASALDANAIDLLNRTPAAIKQALTRLAQG